MIGRSGGRSLPDSGQLGGPIGVAHQASDSQGIIRFPILVLANPGHLGQLRREVQVRVFLGIFFPGFPELRIGNEAVQRIVLPHGRDQRKGKVDAHFPKHPVPNPGRGEGDKPGLGRSSQFQGPAVITAVPGSPADLVEGLHPFGQIMEVLSVPVPFQLLVVRLAYPTLGQRLAYPQSPEGGVSRTFLFPRPLIQPVRASSGRCRPRF